MATATLPTLAQLKLRMTFTVSLITVATTGFIVLFLAPTLEFGPEELRLFAWEGLVAILLMGPVAYRVQKRLCGAIFEYVRRQPLGEVTPELRREAFSRTLRLPGAMFKFAAPCYPAGAFVGGGIAVLYVEAWGPLNLGVMIVAACATGLVTQILAYLSYKVSLEPVRAVLAAEIDDPDARMAAAPMLPMGRKLFILVSSLTVCTVYFTLSLAFGHASTLIEENAVVAHPNILATITQRFEEADDAEAWFREAQRVYAPTGVMLSLLDPAQGASGALSTANGLSEREVQYILTHSDGLTQSATRNSISYDSDNSFTWMVLPGDGRILAASTPQEVINPNLDAVGAKIGVVASLVVVISMIIAWLAARELHGAITTLKSNIRRVAAGDLTPGERFESEDEMGELARSLDIMSESLRRTVRQVADTSSGVEESSHAIATATENVAEATRDQVGHIQQVTESMENISSQVAGISDSACALSESVEQSSSSISELGSMGLELDRNASVLSGKAQESSNSTEQMIQSIRGVTEKTDSLAGKVQDASRNMQSMVSAVRAVYGSASETTQLADRVRKASERGRDCVRRTIQGMEEIRQSSDAAYQIIQNLGTRTQEIGGILNVIDGVAAETSLLALNAAIIAAQAGEHGRPFAVVAEQVKGLATRVLSSTKEIGEVIRGLQEEGANAVGAVEGGVERVMTGVELSADAGESLEQIESAASATEEQIAQIVAAVREQSEATEMVVVVIEEILAGFAEIQRAGEEQRSGSDQVLQNTADVGEVAKHVHGTAREQTSAARHIAQSVESIHQAVDHTNSALQEQSSAAERVAESMEQMLARTKTNEESVQQMASATAEMLQRAESLREQIQNFKF